MQIFLYKLQLPKRLGQQARKGFRPLSAMFVINFLGIFWEFFWRIFLEEFFWRNFFGGFFCLKAAEEEGRKFTSLEVRAQAHRT